MKKFYNFKTHWGTTEKIYLKKGEYLTNKTLAVSAICKNGEQWGMVTVNVDEEPLNEKCAFVKDYSENEGMANFLVKNNTINAPIAYIFIQGRKLPPCKYGFVAIFEYEFDLNKLSK